ncbi:ABC transporter permease [Nonomuraea sp. NPDC046570]|uniref:ABC transporter permease n=1 Tax=Nonomuraea sp. NPDC046570 TaxID=3155255 RepID=UPI0033F0D686
MTNRIVQESLLSYRALFTWLNPLGYLSSRIVRPIGLAVTFGALSSHYGGSIGATLAGASLLAGAHAVIYGMALSVGNERSFGTFDLWMASPQSKLAAICRRAAPHVVDGFLGGMVTYLSCCALFGILPMPVHLFAGALLLALVSSFGYGLMVSGASMWIKDHFVPPNFAYLTLMVLSGALVGSDRLPEALQPVMAFFPLSDVSDDLLRPDFLADGLGELAVGALWAVAGVLLVLSALRRARQ